MTYILGWKSGASSFLCGDTAITRDGGPPIAPDQSSFGEASFTKGSRHVREGLIKMINLGNAAIGLCGDVDAARDFIREFSQRLDGGMPSSEALSRTVSNRTPMNSLRSYSLIVALRDAQGSRLFCFNARNDGRLLEIQDGYAVHLGSMSERMKRTTQKWVGCVVHEFRSNPDHALAVVLAVVQSFGIHDYLMNESVGGVFLGAVVDAAGVRWQKDTLYMIYGPDFQERGAVETIARENVLVVHSSINHRCIYFGDNLMGGVSEAWKARWWDEAFEHGLHGQFDYICLLGNGQRTVLVCEMNQQLKSANIDLTLRPTGTPRNVDFVLGLRQDVYDKLKSAPEKDDGESELIPMQPCFIPFSHPAATQQ